MMVELIYPPLGLHGLIPLEFGPSFTLTRRTVDFP